MDARIENIKIEKPRTVSKIVTRNKIVGRIIKDNELLLFFQCADEVFNGFEFFEDQLYDGVFLQND